MSDSPGLTDGQAADGTSQRRERIAATDESAAVARTPLELRFGWPPRVQGSLAELFANFFLLDRLEGAGSREIGRFLSARTSAYVKHLAGRVPAVREALGSPSGQATRTGLSALPIFTRAQVREHLEAHGALPLPKGHGAAQAHSTSGSTGVPLRFYMSDLANRFNAKLYLHDHFRRHGRDPARAANFLSGKLPPHDGEHLEYRKDDSGLQTGLIRARKAAGFTVEAHADWLRRHPAPYLIVHPRLFAGILDTWSRERSPPRGIEQVMTVGETVDAELRAQARDLLGARIVDRYSSEEVGPIAFQCPSLDDWLHVAVANVVVETLDESGRPAGEGVPGRVVVTAFNNWATPLLRYELGDVAALHGRCACGAQLPALTRLLGRRRELIRLPSGERRFLRVVASHWLDIAPVREWRITQREPLSLEAELVCSQPLTPDQRQAAVDMLRGLTDPAFRITIIERDAIDWGSSFKRADVVSLV